MGVSTATVPYNPILGKDLFQPQAYRFLSTKGLWIYFSVLLRQIAFRNLTSGCIYEGFMYLSTYPQPLLLLRIN